MPTTDAGHRRVLTAVRRQRVAGVIIASTGASHQGIVTRVQHTGVPVTVVTPQVITSVRQSFGRTATTDARVLARYGEMHQPDPSRAPTPTARDLRAVLSRREDLVVHLVAEKTRRTQCAPTSRLWPHLAAAIAVIEHQLAAVDAEIEDLVAGDPPLAARWVLLRTVPGIGRIIRLVLVASLPELGDLDRRGVGRVGAGGH